MKSDYAAILYAEALVVLAIFCMWVSILGYPGTTTTTLLSDQPTGVQRVERVAP